MRVLPAYLLGLAVIGAPLHAQTAQETAALAVALEICANPAPDAQSVATEVTEGGWTLDGSGKVVPAAMFSAIFHMHYSSASAETLDYAQQNSHFMMVSILGNSALPDNQPGYTVGGLKLGTIGLTFDTPYCILSGPGWVYDSLATSDALFLTTDQPDRVPSDPAKTVLTGVLEEATVSLVRLDLAAVDAAYLANNLPDTSGLRASTDATTLLIQPKGRAPE